VVVKATSRRMTKEYDEAVEEIEEGEMFVSDSEDE
jgi:hypothetical protein